MTNFTISYHGINANERRTARKVTITTKPLETAQIDANERLTMSDVMWSIAIYGGFFLSFIFAIIMLGGVI